MRSASMIFQPSKRGISVGDNMPCRLYEVLTGDGQSSAAIGALKKNRSEAELQITQGAAEGGL